MLNHDKQNGVILPVVLWIVLICMVVTANYATDVRLGIKTLSNTKDTTLLNYAARSGIYAALSNLLQDNQNVLPGRTQRVFDGDLDGNQVMVNAATEVSELSINQVGEEQIASILSRNGVEVSYAMSIAQRIVDWRDRDNLPRPGGMEDYDYYAAGYKYGCKDDAISDFEELKLISGVDKTIFRILKNNMTLYPMSANKVIRLTSVALKPGTGKTYKIVAVVHLTGIKNKPYRFIKWTAGGELI